MEEIWNDIDGYEGLYQVSNMGRVKSRVWTQKHNGNEHFLKATPTPQGYREVSLYITPNNRKKVTVHKLVATAFIPNPNHLPAINHKDEDKTNNRADNLEWCTYSYNNAYGTARLRTSITKGMPVQQYTLSGVLLAEYQSIGIAAKLLNIHGSTIYKCCKGTAQSAHGYIWRYKEDYTSFSHPQ